MDEKDFQRIEKLFSRQKEEFQHFMGIVEEKFQHKLDIVVEGHQLLNDKIDRVEIALGEKLDRVEGRLDRFEVKMEGVGSKVDAVVADFSALRSDTEVHHGMYRVKESV